MSANRTVYPYFVDTPPTASLVTPVLLNGALRATFSEDVHNVTTSNLIIRPAVGGSPLPTKLTSCKNASNTSVSCATGPVRTAVLKLTKGMVPGRLYDAIVDPSGLAAAAQITDAQGSLAPTQTQRFRASVSVVETNLSTTPAWATVVNSNAFGSSYVHEDLPKASQSFDFTGTQVTWDTVTGPTQGLASVFIDGVSKGTVDNSAAATHFKVARTFSGLPPGSHTITIVVVGQHGANGTGQEVSVDAFGAGGSTFGTPATRAQWRRVSDSKAAGGFLVVSHLKSSAMRFVFDGTGVTWYTVLGPNMGKAQIFVDGNLVRGVDLYNPTRVYNTGETVKGLASGFHTLRIVVTGTKDPASTDSMVAIDGYLVQ
jgi:hypothetical protein